MRSVDTGALFGKKDNPNSLRQDWAKTTSDAIILGIDKEAWEKVKLDTVKSEGEQKIEFLLRYVPKLRMSPRGIIEELEILFVKECYTQGYKVQKEGEFLDSVYFVRSGTCSVSYPITASMANVKAALTPEEQINHKYITLYTLSKLML